LGAPCSAPAGVFNAQGQFVGTVSPQITALLAQFPNGGPRLRAAIAQAVEINTSLAGAAVFSRQRGHPSPKESGGSGPRRAATFFGRTGATSSQQQVQAALTFADAGIQAGVSVSNSQTQASSYQGIPGFNNSGVTTGGCSGPTVSPSRPSNC